MSDRPQGAKSTGCACRKGIAQEFIRSAMAMRSASDESGLATIVDACRDYRDSNTIGHRKRLFGHDLQEFFQSANMFLPNSR